MLTNTKRLVGPTACIFKEISFSKKNSATEKEKIK